MVFQGIVKAEDHIWLRYKTTYTMSWSIVLDFMQVFLDDLVSNIYGATLLVAGAEPNYVKTIKQGLLCKTEDFIKENGAIILAGKSRAFNAEIEITAYNQLKIVDVKIRTTETKLVEDIENNNHLLDVYMNSLEINAYARDSRRSAINKYGEYIMTPKEDENFEKIAKKFIDYCYNLDANPFPKKEQKKPAEIDITCLVCNHKFKFDESKIPDGAMYEAMCPKCGMLMKRKKV